MSEPRVIILASPSGGGKTTIARALLAELPRLQFSVSATTRPQREGEVHGKDYFFLTEDQFRDLIAAGDLLEYEEVYPGRYYGTLKSAVEKATNATPILLDVDVKGAMTCKAHFKDDALSVYVRPPSIEVLRNRLEARGSETPETLSVRLQRAEYELSFMDRFDVVIVNDVLETAVSETLQAVKSFLVT